MHSINLLMNRGGHILHLCDISPEPVHTEVPMEVYNLESPMRTFKTRILFTWVTHKTDHPISYIHRLPSLIQEASPPYRLKLYRLWLVSLCARHNDWPTTLVVGGEPPGLKQAPAAGDQSYWCSGRV